MRSNEGLEAIARYNGFDKERGEDTALFTESISLAQKRFISFKLYAKFRKKRKYQIKWKEAIAR